MTNNKETYAEEFEAHLNQIKEDGIDRSPVKLYHIKPEDDYLEKREIVRLNKVYTKGYLKALQDYNIPVPDKFAQNKKASTKNQEKTKEPKAKPVAPQKKPKPTKEKNKFDLLDI